LLITACPVIVFFIEAMPIWFQVIPCRCISVSRYSHGGSQNDHLLIISITADYATRQLA